MELVDTLVLGTSALWCEGSSPFSPTKNIMKVTIENKKGLNKDLKVFVDKKVPSELKEFSLQNLLFELEKWKLENTKRIVEWLNLNLSSMTKV